MRRLDNKMMINSWKSQINKPMTLNDMKFLICFLYFFYLFHFSLAATRTEESSVELFVTHNAIKVIAYLYPFNKENLRLLKKQKWPRVMEIVGKNNVDEINSFTSNVSASFSPSLRTYSLRMCFFLVALSMHMPQKKSLALINYVISEFYRGNFAQFRHEIKQLQAICRIHYDFMVKSIRGDFVFAGDQYVGYEASAEDEEIRWSIIYLLENFRLFRIDYGFEKDFAAAIVKITKKFIRNYNEDEDDIKEDFSRYSASTMESKDWFCRHLRKK